MDKLPGSSRRARLPAVLLMAALFQTLPLIHAGAQEYQVSEPRLELEGSILHIYYDILGSAAGQLFYVALNVEDENGNPIPARQLTGDVGDNIRGGSDRHITWEYEKDNVFLDAEIFIRVNARLMVPPVTSKEETGGQETREQASAQRQVQEEEHAAESRPSAGTRPAGKTYSRPGLILQSVALPGLGLTRVSGNPHWIKGVAGYGCIAGSVVLNRMAISSFDSVSDFDTVEESQAAYDRSVTMDNASEILAYAAIAIWITDLIWTVVGTSSMSDRSSQAHHRGISLTGDVDPFSRTPTFGMVYRF